MDTKIMVNLQMNPGSVMGKRQLEAVTVYVSAEVKQKLEEWANEEERSVSWIGAKVITDAIAAKQQGKRHENHRAEETSL
ncbi:MAG TPA: hypothetical protein V6C65_06730 [Allocoleopsis sp.]